MIFETSYDLMRSRMLDSASDTVLVTGVFDVLHAGHISLLEFASSLGNVYVGINSDSSVKQLKGSERPINNTRARLTVINSIAVVKDAFAIDETSVTKAILGIMPTYWVKGSDYTLETLNQEERKAAESVGTKIVFARKVEGYSSTSIIERMKA